MRRRGGHPLFFSAPILIYYYIFFWVYSSVGRGDNQHQFLLSFFGVGVGVLALRTCYIYSSKKKKTAISPCMMGGFSWHGFIQVLYWAFFFFLEQVQNGKLVSDIGFKIKVTIDDILEILKMWRSSQRPFKARYCCILFSILDFWYLSSERDNLFSKCSFLLTIGTN